MCKSGYGDSLVGYGGLVGYCGGTILAGYCGAVAGGYCGTTGGIGLVGYCGGIVFSTYCGGGTALAGY